MRCSLVIGPRSVSSVQTNGMEHSDDAWLRQISIRELIDWQASSAGTEVFLIDAQADRCISFAQLQREVQAVACFITAQGVPAGSSVAYAMHNGRCCAITLLGIIYGGYRAVSINLVAGRDVISYVLDHSETRLILTQNDYQQLIGEALAHDAFSGTSCLPPMHCVDHDLLDSWLLTDSAVAHAELPAIVNADIDALLMYTSGTTGKPKGVLLSHSNLIAGGRNVVVGHELRASDRALCVLPLYHINGLCVTLFGPLVAGASLVLPERFSTSAFWSLIDEHRCTWFSVVPTQIAYLLRDADSQKTTENFQTAVVKRPLLRFGRSASAPLSADVHGAFEQRFAIPMIETMGLTETAAQIVTNPMPPGQRKLGSPGLPVGDEVIIVDKQMQELPAGMEGELLVRGPNVMQRYFKNVQATKETLINDGWLRTGDLGSKDEDGYLYITGRLKELIIKGGENIAPREIDDALYQHADVVEAAAFARSCKNFGQRVEAAVALRENSSLHESDLMALCVERLGAFKCPDKIHFLEELPKGPSGKIQRQKIIAMVS